jgi:Cof subfamily protein (haloacid dehalogenase superfamily)
MLEDLKFKPRLLAIDLDGTLISDDETAYVSSRTRTSLQLATNVGIEIVLITGRPPRWMGQVREKLGTYPAIISNGAYAFDLNRMAILIKNEITISTQTEIISRIQQLSDSFVFATEDGRGFRREPQFPISWDDDNDDLGYLDTKALSHDCAKILVRSKKPIKNPDFFLNTIANCVGDIADVTRTNSSIPMIEITARGVNKKSSLQNYAAKMQVRQIDTYAIGDSVNDFEMLRWAGTSWIMKNSHPRGLLFADYEAGEFNEDGAAQIIEHLCELPFRERNY